MQKQKLENLIDNFNLENLSEFLYDANLDKDRQDLSDLNNEDIFSDIQKLGEIETEDKKKIIVAAIKVENDLSERSSRKKQYDLGKKILTNYSRCEAGIFVFYDEHGSFRFSLIYPTYSGTKRVLNSFKRYTYFVSSDSQITNKTFLKQIGEGDFSTLEKIKEAFSVEKVTKEFFKEYKNLFEELVKELDKNHTFKNEAARYNINTENFAKKLLGQIVFLYFLQKKCWLGATKDKSLKQGDKDFLQNLFDKKYIKYNNFFNDVLEHLFYGALNKKSDKSGTFYRDYFKCQIPFLNGGLFDPEYNWADSKIYLDDKIFKQILEVFNRYNFTVDENSPMDQEIAIDPEMLGKVFENLLSENLRKGKGTYYTPREIVHYMCQESLINYLATKHSNLNENKIREYLFYSESFENFQKQKGESFAIGQYKELDNLLENIKICDPACGSGAFLVGMLNEIVKLRIFLQTTADHKSILQKSEYDLKKETIQNCIYGVDIDPGAIEIAKLRLWLSLVVDYELEEIEPLPNLDYKIMQGNSLLEELVLGDTSIKLFDQEKNKTQVSLLENEEQVSIDKLNSLHKKYFALNDLDEKKKIKKEIDDIEYEVIKKSVEKEVKKLESDNKKFEFVTKGGMKKKDVGSFTKNLSKQGQIMNVLNDFKKTGVKPFFLWRLYFGDVFEDGGFDVVIANPPYIKEYTEKSAFDGLKNNSYYQGKMDLWYFFGAMGLDLLKDGGIETYISPNNWTTNAGASKFRNKIINDSIILTFLDFGNYKIFESAGIQTMVYVLKKNSEIKNYPVKYGKLLNDKVNNKILEEFINSDFNIKNDEFVKYGVDFKRDKFKDKNVIFLDNNLSEIFKKIKEQANFYLTEKEVANGIHPHYDYVSKKTQQILGNSYKIGDGIFVLSNTEKNKLNLTKKELELIKPYYTTKQIHKWQGDLKNKEWIIYTDSKFKNPKNIKPYPNIKKHLDKFQKIITSSNKPYGLHRARDEKFFKDEKIIVARKCAEPQFCYTDFDCYVSATFYVIKTERADLKYLTALFNSRLIKFWLKNQGKMQGDNYQIDKEPLLNLPLKVIDAKKQKPFIKLVDQILEKKKDNPQADISDLEKKIDEMVYKLYNLTEEEIGIIENLNKKL